MVVLLPLLPGEIILSCRCGSIGLGSPVRERSNFYVSSDRVYRSECRRCTSTIGKEAKARYRERHRERIRAAQLVSRDRRKAQDPDGFRERARRNQQRYQKSLQKDPERRRARNESARINHRLRNERNGRSLVIVEEVPTNGRRKNMVDIRPFRAWLRHVIERERQCGHQKPTQVIAGRIGVTQRTVTRWLGEGDMIDEMIVDRAASRMGSVMAWEILTFNYTEQQGAPEPMVVVACATPGCRTPRIGGRFCHVCTDNLARIRGELDQDAALMSANGGAQRRQSKSRDATRTPTCTRQGCWNPRRGGETFCDDCAEAGYVEEDE